MASMKLGSKSEVFFLDGLTWFCSKGLPSDIIIDVGDTSFHLHKFPLLSRSGLLEHLIEEHSKEDEKKGRIRLDDIPGGAKTFLLAAKFCYEVQIELTALNVVSLRCAAEYLQMTEDYIESNLISQTEHFLDEVLSNWADSLRVLEACEEVLLQAEELHIVSRCIASLASKASCTDPALFGEPTSGPFWNGITTELKPDTMTDNWWYEDVSSLNLPLYRRLILEVGTRGVKPEKISGSIMHYANKHLPLAGRQPSNRSSDGPVSSDEDRRNLLEEIVDLLPRERGVTLTKFLLNLLRTSMMLHASEVCRENLEKLIGAQLDRALLEDLLIPNMGYSSETLYDIDCVQRMLDHFMASEGEENPLPPSSNCDEGQLVEGSDSLTPMTMVANLIDSYLAEVAPDVNLKIAKFQSLAVVIPDYARPLDDGVYRAIDIYLKAHPWLIDSEREQICRLMNCQKLSLEASTHAAQNERLPLRVIVQVLFFEQLRLRTSIAGWFFVSDNMENSQNPGGNLGITRTDRIEEVRERVSELEKECLSMKQDLQKLAKAKGSWNLFFRRFGFRQKPRDPKQARPKEPKPSKPSNPKVSAAPTEDGKQNHQNENI
ncbi:hypothetical protein CRG98_023259 [Punica granatum]|uniref:BTB/POZ domain-containing protein At5g03250-like n=1 Tax=Punica granatum TaxID=22663 RepID=A0A2I0JJC8_PUNGR|nr:hypothetical protein CRG98_023259 [Punica granatum]